MAELTPSDKALVAQMKRLGFVRLDDLPIREIRAAILKEPIDASELLLPRSVTPDLIA